MRRLDIRPVHQPHGRLCQKRMRDCTGEEIAREWLYHIGVPVERIDELAAKSCNCVPVMMPRVTTYFICRKRATAPTSSPTALSTSLSSATTPRPSRDTVFTTEYSVRTAMEAVYTLCHVDRGVPEVFNSVYDVRVLMQSTKKAHGRPPSDRHEAASAQVHHKARHPRDTQEGRQDRDRHAPAPLRHGRLRPLKSSRRFPRFNFHYPRVEMRCSHSNPEGLHPFFNCEQDALIFTARNIIPLLFV